MGRFEAIRRDQVTEVGHGLNRPECVVAHRTGLLFAPCWDDPGGVSIIEPDGTIRHVLAKGRAEPLRPNGIALLDGGSFLVAHLGETDGGVYRLAADGTCTPVLTEVDGAPLPPTNFVLADAKGRLWVTVSTRLRPRTRGYRGDHADGFIVLLDGGEARVVADNLGYTNECAIDQSGRRLYVNETFGRRISTFDIEDDGQLTNKQVVAAFGSGVFPDGLALDVDGGLWITSIVSNRLLRVAPDGTVDTVLDGGDPQHVATVEDAYHANELDGPHLSTVGRSPFGNISNMAFGGPDLRSGFLGCLLNDHIFRLHLPIAGLPMPHWDFDLGPLAI